MPDYLEIYRFPAYGEDEEYKEPFRALNFFRHEGFETIHRDCTVLDIEEPEVTVYFRAESFGGAYAPNPVGAALLWYWLPKDQPLARVYGDLTVTGRRDSNERPTPLREDLLPSFTAWREVQVKLAHVTQPEKLERISVAHPYFVDAVLELCQLSSFMTLSDIRVEAGQQGYSISATYE